MRHDISYTPYFCALWAIILPFAIYAGTNFFIAYVVYFLFQGVGIGIGLHRIICHDLKVWKPFKYLSVFLGVMTHSGGVKNSALSHVQHHHHADTVKDIDKKRGMIGKLSTLTMSTKRQVIERINADKVLLFLDDKYYAMFAAFYLACFFLLSSSFLFYVVMPASFAAYFHNYLASRYLHGTGYTNFEVSDNSTNSVLMMPLMFGENWHNNHHGLLSFDNSYRWWEVDLLHWVCKPFYEKNA
jgi:sn-1 stearoyl-lipid 9-desaturase